MIEYMGVGMEVSEFQQRQVESDDVTYTKKEKKIITEQVDGRRDGRFP